MLITKVLISTSVSSVAAIVVAYFTSKITLKNEKKLIHFGAINNQKILDRYRFS